MKLPIALAAALLVGGCATTASRAPSAPHWLVGAWLMLDEGGPNDVTGCDSGLPIGYAADGTYSMWEESGVWRLEANRLTETATRVHETADPAEVALGRPYVSRIERLGADRLRKTFADGSSAIFLRCPPRR